jgi:hypothetical protein
VLFPGKNGKLEGPAVVVGHAEKQVYIDHGGKLISISSDQVLPAGPSGSPIALKAGMGQKEHAGAEVVERKRNVRRGDDYSQTSGGWHEYLDDAGSSDS